MQNSNTDSIDRRTFVRRTGAVTGAIALAGCTGDEDDEQENGDDGENGDEGPSDDYGDGRPTIEVEDPPNAVYLPTHREAMRMLEPVEAGEYTLAPMLSYPHPFWTIAGSGEDAVERETPEDGRGVHMMFALWDRETGTVLPVDDGAQIRVEKDGERIGSPVSPWSMISQEMGFHFGDNVTLSEDGTYAVEVTIPPVGVRTTGDLAGRLDDRATATFEFEYDDEFRHEVIDGVDYLDEDRWGDRGALEPMDHGSREDDDGQGDHGDDGDGHDEHGEDGDHDGGHDHVPYSALPDVDEYAGTLLAAGDSDADGGPTAHEELPRSDDAAILATLFDAGSADAARLSDAGDSDGQYLLVSPRTPYNRVPLADAALDVTIERDGETVVDTALEQTLDGEYGIHYGTAVADVRAGDSVTVTIESPPQVARHQGYDTAFLDMPPVEFTVPEGE